MDTNYPANPSPFTPLADLKARPEFHLLAAAALVLATTNDNMAASLSSLAVIAASVGGAALGVRYWPRNPLPAAIGGAAGAIGAIAVLMAVSWLIADPTGKPLPPSQKLSPAETALIVAVFLGGPGTAGGLILYGLYALARWQRRFYLAGIALLWATPAVILGLAITNWRHPTPFEPPEATPLQSAKMERVPPITFQSSPQPVERRSPPGIRPRLWPGVNEHIP